MNDYVVAQAKESKSGTITITVPIEEVEPTVSKFKKECPTAKHVVTLDWDDETLYRVKFTWEPGKFGVVSIQTPTPTVRPPTARVSKQGGPRW
jgi:hypothetical protein